MYKAPSPRIQVVVLAISLLAIFPIHLQAQNAEGQNWYFGVRAGLSFATTPPTVLVDGATAQVNATACMSDENGNLLFYTDGRRIWNRHHQLMPNSDGIDSYNGNLSQQVVIVHHPGDVNLYYVFHITEWNYPVHRHRLKYYTVNMSGGDGVVESKNNVLPTDDILVKIAAVEKRGEAFWIVVQGDMTGKYYCFKGTASGVDPTPVVTDTGVATRDSFDYGNLRVSPNGKMLAATNVFSNRLSLFRFDFETGVLRQPLFLSINEPAYVEFSPNGRLLYLSSLSNCSVNTLYQYSLSSYSASPILASRVSLGSAPNIGALQRGPDDRIYVGRRDGSGCNFYDYIGTIDNPNVQGTGATFKPESIHLQGGKTFQGLPNFAVTLCKDLTQLPKEVVIRCDEASYMIDVSGSVAAQLRWDDGLTAPIHEVNFSGYYWVESTLGHCAELDTIHVVFETHGKDLTQLPKEVVLCDETSYMIDASGSIAEQLRWDDGLTAAIREVNYSDYYWVESTLGHCVDRDTIHVVFERHKVEFSTDTVTTFERPVTLTPSGDKPDDIVWNNNSAEPSLITNEPGQYSFTATINGCVYGDTITLIRRELFIPNVITVNGDTRNDFFLLSFIEPGENWEVHIYNRYGKEIFSDPSYKNNWQISQAQLCYYRVVNRDFGIDVKGSLHVMN